MTEAGGAIGAKLARTGNRPPSSPKTSPTDVPKTGHHPRETELHAAIRAKFVILRGALKFISNVRGDLRRTFGPEDVLAWIYAVFHSLDYRELYEAHLKLDFPRVPLSGSTDLFRELAALGHNLLALHLLESPNLDNCIAAYIGPKHPEVSRIGWSVDTVWLDAATTKKGQPPEPGTIGFKGVPEDVWNFHIGGYQVCEKWLKDRKGRTLSDEDIAHYQKIVVAIAETIRLMAEIDAVIEQHGGWPGAFVSGAAAEA